MIRALPPLARAQAIEQLSDIVARRFDPLGSLDRLVQLRQQAMAAQPRIPRPSLRRAPQSTSPLPLPPPRSTPTALPNPPQGSAVDLIRLYALRHNLDPQAVLAVAQGEGGLSNREGDIGDLAGGGSYGPFQLYAQGALPARFRGNPTLADTWAWSPEGIDYATRKMAEVGAAGLTGRAAVERIIRNFERPADPDSSVANALRRLGL